MQFTETFVKGAYIIDIKKIEDNRGFFGRAFCTAEFAKQGLTKNMVQTNVSYSKLKGTLRGLHLQVAPNEEAKLVRCTRGAIYDVLVDLRMGSETYMQWFGAELSADSFRMLYIPEGCAHGYLTLMDETDVMYQVSADYTPQAERGFRWNDPLFAIEWPLQPVHISEKDQNQPLFNQSALQAI